MTAEPVCIIGMGVEGRKSLSQNTVNLILSMDEVWGSERLLTEWHDVRCATPLPSHSLTDKIQSLKDRHQKRIAVLASGDPGFYGIAKTILRYLPVDEIQIFPQISSLQYAFARAGIPWQDAVFSSVHARPVSELIGLVRRNPLLGVLTDPKQSPAVISKILLEADTPDCRVIVCENLGTDNERLTDTRLTKVTGQDFAPLNVMILQADQPFRQHHTGVIRPDDAYDTKKGMITKHDVRVISIDRLAIEETDIVWDIGACSGAVSIEMGERAWRGQVYAIEKDPQVLPYFRNNIVTYGAMHHVKLVEGEAPDALHTLPLPKAVFIGGSGGRLIDIFEHIQNLPVDSCRIVANFTVIENLSQAIAYLRSKGYQPEVVQAGFSYGRKIGTGTRFEPNNPVYILSVTLKGAQNDNR